MFGPDASSANPFAADMADDPIFSERGGKRKMSPLTPEPKNYWDDLDELGGAAAGSADGREEEETEWGGGEREGREDDGESLLRGLLGGSKLETLGQDWNEEEDWDGEEDEFLDEEEDTFQVDDDEDDAFLAQFEEEGEEEEDLEGEAPSLFRPGDTESSEEESILDKLRVRNPKGASDVALRHRLPALPTVPSQNAATTATTATPRARTEGHSVKPGKPVKQAPTPPEQQASFGPSPERDLDAIFGKRPAEPASSSLAPPQPTPSKSTASSAPLSSPSSPSAPVTAAGKSLAVPSKLAPPSAKPMSQGMGAASISPKPDWWLKDDDKPPPLGGASLSSKDVVGAADAGAEEEEEEDKDIAFGPASYNSKEAQMRRLLEIAAEKLLEADGDDSSDAMAEYFQLLERANVSSVLNKRIGGNLLMEETQDAAQDASLNASGAGLRAGDAEGEGEADGFLEASMFGWSNMAEGGDAAVYSALIDAIDEQDDEFVEGPDSQLGWPAADVEAGGAAGQSGVGQGAGAREGYLSVDVTGKFRVGVENSRKSTDGANAFASAFEAKALKNKGPKRDDLFESDPYLLQLGKALATNASASAAPSLAPRSGLPGRKSMDPARLQAMMSRVNSAAPSAPPPAAASRATEDLRNAAAPGLLAASAAAAKAVGSDAGKRATAAGAAGEEDAAEEETGRTEVGAGAAGAAATDTAAIEGKQRRQADEAQADEELDEQESPLLTSAVPVQLMQSLGLLQGQVASALPSTAFESSEAPPLAPITGAAPPGGAASVMTYNALVSVLQRRVDSRLESLMGTIDAQALAARRDMLLTQMTPEAIALNCLSDIFESKIVPMQDTQTRLGPRLRDIDLDWSYKERLWELHDRLQNDFKFRMLFVPGYVRASWLKKKEAIRAGSLEVRAVTLQRRRRAAAHEEGASTALDSPGSEAPGPEMAEDRDEDDAAEVAAERASRASSAWEKLKAQARLQRPGSRTVTRQAPSGASVKAESFFSDIGSGSTSTSESSEPFSERFSPDEFDSFDSFQNIEGLAAPAKDSTAVAGGPLGEEGRGAGGRELPISEDMSLAEIREFVRRESLDLEVKTSGTGRTKQAILKDVAAVWVRRQQ